MKPKGIVFICLSLLFVCLSTSFAINTDKVQETGEFTNYEELRQHIRELYQQKNYQEAADLLERALDQFPDHILAITYNLSLMYTHLGEYTKGAQALLSGLEHDIFYSKYSFVGKIWTPFKDTNVFKKFREQNESMRIEAQKMAKPEILVLMPKGFSASKKYPLFIALHGGGGNIAGFKNNWSSSKLKKDFITAYLQSSQVIAMDGYNWTEDIELTKKEIDAAYKKIVKDYPIDTQNVLIGGFSSGGVAALKVILDSTIPAGGFVVLCPARPKGFSVDRVKMAKMRGVRGALITTEMDPRLPDQKKMAEMFKTEEFPLQFIITPNIGHWFPEDMDNKIDSAIDFIQRKEK